MKIAVQNPVFILRDQKKNFNGYDFEFFLKYVQVIYITDFRKIGQFKRKLKELERTDIKLVYSVWKLNEAADILICFNGTPNRIQHRPPRFFKGMKVFHVMDYVFWASRAAEALRKNKVDYLMGYVDHSKYCPFFQKYYAEYEGKVIQVPFGYGNRFADRTPFARRMNKCIALGSVNPVRDRKGSILEEYFQFYQDKEFTHELRRAVVLHREEWKEAIDDMLPTYPETKNPYYDPVKELNQYTMFINDAGLMNFPPARTYEGIASGCVMIAEDLPIWKEYGFVDGVNCILFEKGNYTQMIDKINYYKTNLGELTNIHNNSLELSKRYTHEAVAERLYLEIVARYQIFNRKK